jgi:signal transduction histidine kinase
MKPFIQKIDFSKIHFFWSAHPLQGIVESLVVGLLVLGASTTLEGSVETFVIQAAVFFLCGAAGMWAVLRIRLPRPARRWWGQITYELAIGAILSLVMVFGLHPLSALLRWNAIWDLAGWGDEINYTLLFCIGPGYCIARAGVRIWLRWDQMRRTRMVWSLTHAHLTVVVAFALLGALVMLILAPFSSIAFSTWTETNNPLISLLTGLLVTLFPAAVLVTIATVVALTVMLPPLAVFSYFVARRTTRRLEALAATTAALRAGETQARVPVEGEDEVARLQADFNAMAEKLETSLAELKAERDTVAQVLQARRDLVAGVSHELRTPVATLRAAVETTLDQWDSAPPAGARQKLEIMEGEIRRLAGLIDDLFTLSQAEVNNLPLDCAPTDLRPLVEQVVEAFAPLAWQSGKVQVTAHLPEALPQVHADARRLQQVLLNLLRNAARYTPPGGIVAVLAEDEGEMVRIEVRDTGEGIPPEDLPRIFERFYRGKNSGAESAGLGLALVKELVEAMGGSVSAESTLGEGSCFTVRVRVARVS